MNEDESQQDFIEQDAHSFVINIWFEQINPDDPAYLWRGRITHVASGKRRYLTQLNSISEFIHAYLPQQQSGFTWWIRLRQLWHKMKEE